MKLLFKRNYLIFLLFVLLYLITRLWGLKQFPMFIDETIYARWAQLGYFDPSMRLVSLTDGKPPLFVWLTSLTMNFIGNPITAARLVSIAAGLVTMIGLYAVSVELFASLLIGLLSMMLYIIFPLGLLLNRIGIFDSLLAMFAVWSIYFGVRFTKNPDIGSSLTLALVWGGGLLTKSSGYINMYLLPVTLLLARFHHPSWKRCLSRWVTYAILSISLAMIYFSVTNLSREASFISAKNQLFLYSLSEVFSKGLFHVLSTNVMVLVRWIGMYLTLPLILMMIIAGASQHARRREVLVLLLWFVIPITGMAVFGRMLSTRYIFSILLPLLPFAAYASVASHQKVAVKKIVTLLFCLSILMMVYTDYKILTDLPRAPIPREDLFQYANGWPSGAGMKEIIEYLSRDSINHPIYIVSEGAYGSLPATALEIFLWHNANVERDTLEQIPENIPSELVEKTKTQTVYVIFNQMQNIPNWPLEHVLEFRKGNGESFIRLLRVKNL